MPVPKTGLPGAFFEERPIICGGDESNGVTTSTCYKYEQGNWLNVSDDCMF